MCARQTGELWKRHIDQIKFFFNPKYSLEENNPKQSSSGSTQNNLTNNTPFFFSEQDFFVNLPMPPQQTPPTCDTDANVGNVVILDEGRRPEGKKSKTKGKILSHKGKKLEDIQKPSSSFLNDLTDIDFDKSLNDAMINNQGITTACNKIASPPNSDEEYASMSDKSFESLTNCGFSPKKQVDEAKNMTSEPTPCVSTDPTMNLMSPPNSERHPEQVVSCGSGRKTRVSLSTQVPRRKSTRRGKAPGYLKDYLIDTESIE
jgi:hypothetical protein